MRGRKKLTDLDVDRTLAAHRTWLVENREAEPDDGLHAASAAHWDRHTQAHPNPCYASPCKPAAVCANMLELLMYAQPGPSVELLDALATATDDVATRLARVPVGFALSLEPIERAMKEHVREDEDGHVRHRPFEDGRAILTMPQLVAEGMSILAGLRAAAVSQGPALRAYAAKLRDLALWPGEHDVRTKAADDLLLSATQHLHSAGFDASEIAMLVIDDGDRDERPHARHLKTKKRSLPIDRVRQRLEIQEDHRILDIVTPERSSTGDLSGRQPRNAAS